MKSYYSFLICGHPDKTDVYINGRPLGVYKDGVFVPDMLTIKDFPSPFPFADMESFKQEMAKIVDTIHFKQDEENLSSDKVSEALNVVEESRKRMNNMTSAQRQHYLALGMEIINRGINGGVMD